MMDAAAIRTMVRAHDPLTSVKAAEGALLFVGPHRDRIMRALRGGGQLSSKEISARTGLTVVQVDRRLPDLKADGQAHVVTLDGVDVSRDGYRVWAATSE